MATLSDIGIAAQDAYYQDYPGNSAFFDVSDFMFHAATFYSDLIEKLFQQYRAMTKRDEGISAPEISASWLVKEKFTVKYDNENEEYYTELCSPIFSFNFDAFGYGLQNISTAKCKNATKVSNDEWRFLDLLPTASFCYYYIQTPTRIVFKDNIKEGVALYVPTAIGNDDNSSIADSLVKDVIAGTLTLMFGAKNGNVVKEVDDLNKNNVLQNEANNVTKLIS